jgi:hypothetical protein
MSRCGNQAVFSKNRDRLLNQELAQQFFAKVKAKAQGYRGSYIQSWHLEIQREFDRGALQFDGLAGESALAGPG